MEQQAPRARYDEFAEQFTTVLHDNWSDILLVINRQSPRIAALLKSEFFEVQERNRDKHISPL